MIRLLFGHFVDGIVGHKLADTLCLYVEIQGKNTLESLIQIDNEIIVLHLSLRGGIRQKSITYKLLDGKTVRIRIERRLRRIDYVIGITWISARRSQGNSRSLREELPWLPCRD